ncbi:MAG: hypothetical protein ACYC26_13860 [Phycisphaerales bacterium]
MRAAMRRQWCGWSMWFVVTAMGVVCAVFFADPYRPWLGAGLDELWALDRKWQFYMWVIAVGGSAVASVILWMIGRRGHRVTVIGLWAVFAAVMIVYHAQRVGVMMRMMWKYG